MTYAILIETGDHMGCFHLAVIVQLFYGIFLAFLRNKRYFLETYVVIKFKTSMMYRPIKYSYIYCIYV